MSHFGVSIKCPDTGQSMIDSMLADLHFVPDIGQGLLKWDDLPDDNAPGAWEFWFLSDRLPVEGYAVIKGGPDTVTFVTEVPGCILIPEPSTTALLVVGAAVALLFRRR